jgi:hypothetical protein
MSTPLKKRAFGDDMGKESEITHIPIILMAMYSAIVAFSVLVSLITGAPWWLQVAFYFVDLLVFYVWHYAAHQTWSGEMNKLHMDHHLRVNPVSRFFSSDELNQKKYGRTDFSSFRKSLIVFSPLQSSHVASGLHHEGLALRWQLRCALVRWFAWCERSRPSRRFHHGHYDGRSRCWLALFVPHSFVLSFRSCMVSRVACSSLYAPYGRPKFKSSRAQSQRGQAVRLTDHSRPAAWQQQEARRRSGRQGPRARLVKEDAAQDLCQRQVGVGAAVQRQRQHAVG